MLILDERVADYIGSLRLSADLMWIERWLACVLPVGDGIASGTGRR
jgi:hypothetical protein